MEPPQGLKNLLEYAEELRRLAATMPSDLRVQILEVAERCEMLYELEQATPFKRSS